MEVRCVSQTLGEAYLKSDRIFCEIAEAWEAWASVAVADLALGGRYGVNHARSSSYPVHELAFAQVPVSVATSTHCFFIL